MFDHELLIGSAFVAGTEAKEKILNPKTGALLTELAEASVEQVDAAVEAASKAFDAWARTTPAERSRLLLKLADAIERGRGLRDARGAQLRQAAYPRAGGRDPGDRRLLPLFAGAARTMHGAASGEYVANPRR